MADTLSRAYLQENEQSLTEQEVEYVNMIELISVTRDRIKEIQRETETDFQLQKLINIVRKGWPESRSEVPDTVRC